MNEYLLIPFDKKDEIKKDHPIKWDVAKKLWYFDTVTPYYSKGNGGPRNDTRPRTIQNTFSVNRASSV